jgi:hypothetical protein
MKPRLFRAIPVAALAAAAVAGAVLLWTQPWSGDEASGEPIEARACNVVYEAQPESSEFRIFPIAMGLFNDGKPGLVVEMKQRGLVTDPQTGDVTDESAGAFIDAETGKVLSQTSSTPSDEALLNDVLDTIRVEPFDPATAPWPYSDATTSPAKTEKFPPNGGIEIRVPDPGSGFVLTYRGGLFPALDVHTCKSTMRIQLRSAEVLKQDVHSDDAAAFETFRAEVAGDAS